VALDGRRVGGHDHGDRRRRGGGGAVHFTQVGPVIAAISAGSLRGVHPDEIAQDRFGGLQRTGRGLSTTTMFEGNLTNRSRGLRATRTAVPAPKAEFLRSRAEFGGGSVAR
jgi:hypothetical protein